MRVKAIEDMSFKANDLVNKPLSYAGSRLVIHTSASHKQTIEVGKPIRYAAWNGDVVEVQLEDGNVRLYFDATNFQMV